MKKISFLLLFVFTIACTKTTNTINTKLVVAHRGASGYLPEHTLASKAMAYAMKPHYIEQDVVLSKDNVPIVIHDIYLDDVTDVRQKFPERNREDGRYYVIDFTFSELQSLQVTERFDHSSNKQYYPDRFPANKSTFRLHSLQQEIELIQGLNKSTGNEIGIYPEIKNPSFHRKHEKDISKIVLDVLNEYGYTTKEDNCILQCFDALELERIRKQLGAKLYLVQLIEHTEETKQLTHFASYADGIGPWYKQLISSRSSDGFTTTSLVADAHSLGLTVHPYTFRADALEEFSSFDEVIEVLLFQANADGAFTDFPDKMIQFLHQK